MKTLVLSFCSFLICFIAHTQNFDIILKTNGEEMVGSVKALSDDAVTFIYKNETIEYTVDTDDIVKITFGSGRIQFFKNESSQSSTKANLEDHHNKVAILPFAYIKDERSGSKAISERIQQESYSLFSKHNGELKYQDVRTTNALLIKAGVTDNNIQGYTMGEICHILGVEYVIQGTVSVEKTTASTFNNSSSTTTRKNDKARVDRHGHLIGNIFSDGKSKTNKSSVSTSVQNYSTSMIMNIYNDRGDNIYSQDHTAFWNTEDAYKITLKYLAKRSPLYRK